MYHKILQRTSFLRGITFQTSLDLYSVEVIVLNIFSWSCFPTFLLHCFHPNLLLVLKMPLTFHWCRGTYEYEKKFYNDHLVSLQVMEKNYKTMAMEVEKLRAELTNAPNVDRRAGTNSYHFLIASLLDPFFLYFVLCYQCIIFANKSRRIL